MAHPDENRPRQAPPKGQRPEAAADDLDDPKLERDASTGTEVRTPDTEGARQGEAGAQYTGRQMDDRLKTNPRVEDADDVTEDDEA